MGSNLIAGAGSIAPTARTRRQSRLRAPSSPLIRPLCFMRHENGPSLHLVQRTEMRTKREIAAAAPMAAFGKLLVENVEFWPNSTEQTSRRSFDYFLTMDHPAARWKSRNTTKNQCCNSDLWTLETFCTNRTRRHDNFAVPNFLDTPRPVSAT